MIISTIIWLYLEFKNFLIVLLKYPLLFTTLIIYFLIRRFIERNEFQRYLYTDKLYKPVYNVIVKLIYQLRLDE